MQTLKTIYHIFTHNADEYTTDEKEAYAIYKNYIKEYGCARLYCLICDAQTDDAIEEYCLESLGEYPQ